MVRTILLLIPYTLTLLVFGFIVLLLAYLQQLYLPPTTSEGDLQLTSEDPVKVRCSGFSKDLQLCKHKVKRVAGMGKVYYCKQHVSQNPALGEGTNRK